ncbi:hypothetical protein EWE75_04880 [Sphingomonas populi]|uniref:Uncharacterized protein n=1 Tax=Sphingomonas populi TaxID=2484750 RepID=A0A4Q6Y6N0_9SPHN|nr:hypothetical protein [Sphingomonas populi]RZF65634.1 hypothetical protein EWE75_04880 [Sphingomonas populi]
MSRSIPPALYPVVITQDRYTGCYCNGEWIAVARASDRESDLSRIDWVLEYGPSAGDIEAACFWGDPPSWIASGPTPEGAIEALIVKAAGEITAEQP